MSKDEGDVVRCKENGHDRIVARNQVEFGVEYFEDDKKDDELWSAITSSTIWKD